MDFGIYLVAQEQTKQKNEWIITDEEIKKALEGSFKILDEIKEKGKKEKKEKNSRPHPYEQKPSFSFFLFKQSIIFRRL